MADGRDTLPMRPLLLPLLVLILRIHAVACAALPDAVSAVAPQQSTASRLLAINTWPWTNATSSAFEVLEKGLTAVDAVEAGCTACELLRCDGTVGFGGSPGSDGEVTLDAMIIDGAHSDMGAVGCLRRIRSAISVARAVMEHTSQSILVGEKATAFAVMAGFPEEALESDFSDALHSSWREAKCQPNFYRAFPLSDESCPPYRLPDSNMVRGLEGGLRERETLDVRTETRQSQDGSQPSREENLRVSRDNHDTIGMIAIDKLGNLAAGTSTNGANHKVAGRVGDAAVPGAGAYVDNDVGAATGTGDGDIMMRFLPAFQAVNYMREGMPPTLACEKALVPIALKFPAFKGALVCVSKDGRHGAAAHGWVFHYSFQDPSLAEPQVVEVTPS